MQKLFILPDGTELTCEDNFETVKAAFAMNGFIYEPTASEIALRSRKDNAKGQAALAINLKTLNAADAEAWVLANTGNVAQMREVVRELARMVVAMRDDIWPTLPDEQIGVKK